MNIANFRVDDAGATGPLETACAWLESFDTIALATVVSTWGSAPVPVGEQLVIAPDGHFEGSVSGGCVEVDVIAEAADVIAGGVPKLLEWGVSDESAWRAGLPCGGAIKVFLQPLRAADLPTLQDTREARRARRPVAILTNLETGARHLLDPQQEDAAAFGGQLSQGESAIVALDDGQYFLNVMSPTVRVVLAGATHVAQILAGLVARVGYEAVIVDPRPAFASSERFGETTVLEDWPEAACARFGLDPETAVVCLSHTAHLDDQMLTAALRSDCRYIGALGSRKTHASRVARLRAAGFADADLERINAPVGLNIGAKGPAEIAVSIMAEIIAVFRGGPR